MKPKQKKERTSEEIMRIADEVEKEQQYFTEELCKADARPLIVIGMTTDNEGTIFYKKGLSKAVVADLLAQANAAFNAPSMEKEEGK